MSLRLLYRLVLGIVSIAVLLFFIKFAFYYLQEKPTPGLMLKPLPDIQKQTKLLVIAPHCDDEALGGAGLIYQVLKAGGQVLVVIMTNGDGFTFATEEQFHRLYLTSDDYIRSGYVRQQESLNALRLLGMNEYQVTFLGYPDRGLDALWNEHWETNKPFTSRFTGTDHSPYFNSYRKNAAYAGINVLTDLKEIISKFQPTSIVLPHPLDEHRDHSATAAFVVTSVTELVHRGVISQPVLYTYLVHRGDFPIPHGYKPEASLLPPKPLSGVSFPGWYIRPLDTDTENLKEQAIKEYKSQIRIPIMSSLLESFIRTNELFDEVRLPVVEKSPPGLSLNSPSTWTGQAPLLVNPIGLNPLGSLESKSRITAVYGVTQGSKLWLRFHIPDILADNHQYHLSLSFFQLRPFSRYAYIRTGYCERYA